MKFRYFVLWITYLLMGCSNDESAATSSTNSELKYFGFTLVDTYWDDPTDAEIKNVYIDEVASFSNIADLLVLNPEDQIVSRMQAMEVLQMKAVLHLNEIFFLRMDADAPSGNRYQLRDDYQLRWDTFITTNSLIENQNLIQAFYVGEEPTWNGIPFLELQAASDYIKASIPQVPILIIEAYPILNELQIPASVDWIGFDHYFIKDPQTDPDFQAELTLLKSKLVLERQKLVFVMDTHFIPEIHRDFAGINLEEMGTVAQNYYELAISEPKSIAILGYFWPSGFDSDEAIGARGFPESIKNEIIAIGKKISKKPK